MLIPEPMPDFPTVRQLHWWAAKLAPALRRELANEGISAADLVWPIHRDPEVQELRANWHNHRPFPSDEAILLLILLMAPHDQEVSELDEKGFGAVVTTIMVMAAPEPMPASVRVDICRRRFIASDSAVAAPV